jgi:hypothetical protein
VSHPGNQPSERRFPAARRAPKNHGPDLVVFDLRPQRLAGPEQRFLSRKFIERARAHPFRKRLARAGIFFRLEFCEQAHERCYRAAAFLCRMAS